MLGEYVYKETLNADPIVDHYDLNGQPAYVMVVPDEKGRTASYQLDLPGVDSAKVYTPTIGADSMAMQYVKTINGKLTITVTETPTFVIPVPGSDIADQSFAVVAPPADTKPAAVTNPAQGNALKIYPNPSAGYVSVAFTSADVSNSISVSVLNEQTGKVYKSFTDVKGEQDYAKLIDLSAVSMGVYVIQVKQGNTVITKKLIKIN